MTDSLYDANGNVTETIDGADLTSFADLSYRATQTFYDEFGDVTETVDPTGAVTTSLVDADGETTETIDAFAKTFAVFNAVGEVTATVTGVPAANSSSVSTLMGTTGIWDVMDQVYDAAGNLTETIDGANLATREITTSLVDQFGDVTETVDGLGRPSYFGFDNDGEVTAAVTDVAAGSPTTFAGLLTGVGLWNVTDDLYDANGNVTETIEGANLATSVQVDNFSYYDQFGNVTKTVDSMGDTTVNVYDKDDELVQVDDPTSGTITNEYDLDGNQTLVVDADGNRTTFTFDAMNEKVEEQDPTGDVISYQYDQFGELTSMIDALGNQIKYSYDNDGRETRETWLASGTVTNIKTFTYDSVGEVTEAEDYNSYYVYSYDAAGHEISSDNESLATTMVDESPGVFLYFSYDEFGNRIGVSDNLGNIQTSTYNGDNELATRSQTGAFGYSIESGTGSGSGGTYADTIGGTLLVDYTYTPDGQISTVTDFGNLAGTDFLAETIDSYDADGRMIGQQQIEGNGGTRTTYLNTTYTYNDASELTSEDDNGVFQTYTYDDAGELTNNGTATLTYDANGNRDNTSTYVVGSGTHANEILYDGTWTYTYDTRGDLVGKHDALGNIWTYTYDVGNELVEANERLESGAFVDISYTYDVYGNMIRRVETDSGGSGSNEFFAYDGWKTDLDADGNAPTYIGQENWDVWGEFTTTGANSMTGGAYYDGVYYRLQNLQVFGDSVNSIAGQLVAVNTGPDSVNVFATDDNGSVRAVIDSGGVVVNSIKYNGSGVITSETSSPTGMNYGFQGTMQDASTTFNDSHARWLDLATGQFVSPDDSQYATTSNLYTFAGNAPTDGSDPSGDVELKVADNFWTIYGNTKAGDGENYSDKIKTFWNSQNVGTQEAINRLLNSYQMITPQLGPGAYGSQPKEEVARQYWNTIKTTGDVKQLAAYQAGFLESAANSWERDIRSNTPNPHTYSAAELNFIPADRITSMEHDGGLAYVSGNYAVVLDVTPDGKGIYATILEQGQFVKGHSSDTQWDFKDWGNVTVEDKTKTVYRQINDDFGSGIRRYDLAPTERFTPEPSSTPESGYRIVQTILESAGMSNAEQVLKNWRNGNKAQQILDLYTARKQEDQVNRIAGYVEFVYHALPFGQAWDSLAKGDYADAGISFAGDLASFFTGPLGAAAKSCRVARSIRLFGVAANGMVAAYDVSKGFDAMAAGESPIGYFGDATLRLFGMSAEALAALKAACFPAGTEVRTADGYRLIEDLKPGDMVLARHEDNPHGPILSKHVVRVACREALVHTLNFNKCSIQATADHPFFVENRGWVQARDLQPGDMVLGPDGGQLFESLVEGGPEVVYTLGVADFRTFFVIAHESDLSFWVHNSNPCQKAAKWRNRAAASKDTDRLAKVPQQIASHDAGVQIGRKYAEDLLGLAEAGWVNPFEGWGKFGQGFDDILKDAKGNLWVVDYKGNTASLAEGQMGDDWVKKNIQRLIREAPESTWGPTLQKAFDDGKLKGIAIQSADGPSGTTKILDKWSYK